MSEAMGYYGKVRLRAAAPAAGWPAWTDSATWAPHDFPPLCGGSGEGDEQGLDGVAAEAEACIARVNAAAAAYVEAFHANGRAMSAIQKACHALRVAIGKCDWIDPRPSLPIVIGEYLIEGGSNPNKGYNVRKVHVVPERPTIEVDPKTPGNGDIVPFGRLAAGQRFTFLPNEERFVYVKVCDRTFRYLTFESPHFPIASPDLQVICLEAIER